MDDPHPPDDTTPVEVAGDPSPAGEPSTLTDREEEAGAEAAPAGFGRQQLIENYQALLRARAIHYPVAYQFLRELGRGRQGVVFLVLRQGARGCVTRHAIKLFDPGIYPSVRKYWTDMGRIASQVSRLQAVPSPFLVSRDIYEEASGIGYLQMEAIDGVDLRCFLDPRHLERTRARCTPVQWARFTDVIFRLQDGRVGVQPGVAVYILRRILRGLEALHDQGFVHCDVKPANVMLDRLGHTRLIDFGRAVHLDEKLSFLLGTPYYMAPEVHRREPVRIQSDLYSAALVGLDMLTGRPLVRAREESELLAFKMDLPRRLPELLPDHVRRNDFFVRVLRAFVDPDPARRPANAREAESGPQGLAVLHRQLVQMGKDAEYARELEAFMAAWVDPRTNRVESCCDNR